MQPNPHYLRLSVLSVLVCAAGFVSTGSSQTVIPPPAASMPSPLAAGIDRPRPAMPSPTIPDFPGLPVESQPLSGGAPGMGIPGAFSEKVRSTVPFSGLFMPAPLRAERGEGFAQGLGRPSPGSIFDPGASGPGIGRGGKEMFLDGALDPSTGWPFVFLDHFRPRPERTEGFWMVNTRDCPQEQGSDPWPEIKIRQFDADGRLVDQPFDRLAAQAVNRPLMILVQGNLTSADMALGGLMWSHSWLQYNRCLPPDALVLAFDWPSDRVYRFDVRDVEEKGRRAFVAAFHLARFLQRLPAGSRVSLVGQSYGCLVVLGALHLLGDGCLDPGLHDQSVRLQSAGSAAAIKVTLIAGAADHNWLTPGRKLDRALYGCQGLLNIYNKRDEALFGYPLLRRGGHRQAIGRIGLTNRDLQNLGKLADRYEEHDVHQILGFEHSLLDAVAHPKIGRWMAPYLWGFDPGPVVEAARRGSPVPATRPGAVFRGLIRP